MGVRAARGLSVTGGDQGGWPRLSGTLGKAPQLHPFCRTRVFCMERETETLERLAALAGGAPAHHLSYGHLGRRTGFAF